MTKQLFIDTYYKDAIECEKQTGISAIAILAQAALESSWGEHCPRFAFFGIKDTDGINGNEQLIETTEYSRIYQSVPGKVGLFTIDHVEPVTLHGTKWFKYTGKGYFREYDSALASFLDHAQFFIKNERYAKALTDKGNYVAFSNDVAAAGYGSGPTYGTVLVELGNEIAPLMPKAA